MKISNIILAPMLFAPNNAVNAINQDALNQVEGNASSNKYLISPNQSQDINADKVDKTIGNPASTNHQVVGGTSREDITEHNKEADLTRSDRQLRTKHINRGPPKKKRRKKKQPRLKNKGPPRDESRPRQPQKSPPQELQPRPTNKSHLEEPQPLTTSDTRLYFPNWIVMACELDENDAPTWMREDPNEYMEATLAGCCTRNYSWKYDLCISAGAAGTVDKDIISQHHTTMSPDHPTRYLNHQQKSGLRRRRNSGGKV